MIATMRHWTSRLVEMASVSAVFLLLMLLVEGSEEQPPRLNTCREIHKAKPPQGSHSWSEEYTFPPGESCGVTISLPVNAGTLVNLTDPRNCENYYRCTYLSCDQCPCPVGQVFDPMKKSCEIISRAAKCECPLVSENLDTTTTSTTKKTTQEATTKPQTTVTLSATNNLVPTPAAPEPSGTSQSFGAGHGNGNEKPDSGVTTEVIILAGITSGTVIVIAVIGLVVYLWQRGLFNTSKMPAIPAQGNGGYLPTQPVQERHVYAEIDERMVTHHKHWQHGASVPPIPEQPPPFCPRGHPLPLNYTNSSKRNFHPNHHQIRLNGPYIPRSGETDDSGQGPEDSSCSVYSQYSNSSNQTSLDSNEIDMHTPLHIGGNTDNSAQKNYVSKQVYI